jgi:hypothetical protein
MRERFPSEIELPSGPASFACAQCGRSALELPEGAGTAVPVSRPGFLSLVGVQSEGTQCIFVRQDWRRAVCAQLAQDVEWAQEDRIAYALVICECGVRLGARIAVAGSSDIELLGGVWMLLARLKEAQEDIAPSPKRKTPPLAKGQTTLSFGKI